MSDPTRPNLRQLRIQAKELHRAVQPPVVDAVRARIQSHHPRFAAGSDEDLVEGFSLQEAQHVVAREHGHDSWPKLMAALSDREDADRKRRFVADELRGLENIHVTLAQMLETRLRHQGLRGARVEVQFTDQVTFAEYVTSRPEGWSYSYEADSFAGAAIWDLPVTTATALDTEFTAQLTDVQSGAATLDDLADGAHRQFAGRLCEDIEAAWGPVYGLDMRDIEWEPHVDTPKRTVADPAAIVGLVQLSMDDGGVAMRLCYPYESLTPALEALESVGQRY